ncbi:DUF397 domain-containing protein [Streptomyces sp. 769]|uniref:DUF397 domain-containing protein n=1 Tax=Streptomyces sp. 769 TaxID=1262452 RepID=UPI00057E2FC7|nr:DUF397 domain-containing protein [Streptomyces sp. 769]AJC53956.1 hypothetical protein GZL_01356 [Streptomyces sp. 769]
MSNLYSLPVNEEFENFCGGNLQSEHESCVEVSALSNTEFAVRGSKPEDAGRELRFTTAELDDFARGWVQKRGLAL